MILASGYFELLAWKQAEWREPGNLGNPWGVDMYTEEMRNKEISNGRFAMICVLGIFAAEMVTGKDAIQQFGFSAVYEDKSNSYSGATSSVFTGASAAHRMSAVPLSAASAEVAEALPKPFDPASEVG